MRVAVFMLLLSGCVSATTTTQTKQAKINRAPVGLNPAQQEFFRFCSRHVEDPANFRIITWGPKIAGRNREVKYSCRLIKNDGVPKTHDTVTVFYDEAGYIELIVPDNGEGAHWF